MPLLRMLRHAPGLALSAVITIALAVGATTAVFSVVYGVLLRPLPYADPDSLVRLWEEHPGANPLVQERLSDWTFNAWRQPTTISGMAAYASRSYTVAGGDSPERIDGAGVSPSLFPMLGAAPDVGRFFTDADAVEGADTVVVLSHAFWRRRFGGDPGVVGTTITLDARPFVVVGVAPASFYFPDRDAQIWTPYVMPRRTAKTQQQTFVMSVIARLAQGASVQQVEAEGTAAARSVARPPSTELLFGNGRPVEVRARRVIDVVTAGTKPALLVLMTAVSLVLLVACVNVANLLLARGIGRTREFAIRAALGAGRGDLLRQVLAEGLVLSMFGGIIGTFIAWALVRALPAWAPGHFPRVEDVQVNIGLLAFAMAISLIAGLLAAAVPAVRGARAEVTPALSTGDPRTTGGSGERLRATLLAIEAAIGVVLLVGAALLMRSFVALTNVDAGYDPRNVLSARLHLSGADATPPRSGEIAASLLERMRGVPEVVAAGAGNMAPFGDSSYMVGFQVDRSQPMSPALAHVVTPGYAEALGLRLREGRFFRESDTTSPVVAMLVNEAFVRAYLNDGRPVVGRRESRLAWDDAEIVGVVGNMLLQELDGAPQPEIYVALGGTRGFRREIYLFARTTGDPAAVAPALRALLREVNPDAALAEVGPLSGQVAQAVAEPRFAAAVLLAFAVLALALAATGLYGAMSYMVSRRRREIGIRAALGATKGNLLVMVLRNGLGVTVIGLSVGLIGAALASRAMRPLLFGITPLDPISFAATPLVLLAVAVVACTIPARRAASVDPAEALRETAR
jgi:putative ABC transport system permease protein